MINRRGQSHMRSGALLRAGAALSAVAISAGALVPGVAGARGGGTSTGTSPALPTNPCKYFAALRKTTNHTYQPFVQYTGKISSPSDSTVKDTKSLSIIIDHCHATPKVAAVFGALPAYDCGVGANVAVNMDIPFFGTTRKEPSVTDGTFSFTATNFGIPEKFTVTGSISGHVTIPKHGPGTGSGEITGTVTPSVNAASCPIEHAPYTLKFKRTWSYFSRGGLS
jgi:hypothetical protein